MTKGHKSGRRELKPSLVGHKIPARRDDSDAPAAADSSQPKAAAEVGKDVDCYLPDSEIVRERGRTEPGVREVDMLSKRPGRKIRSGPDR